MHPFSLIQALFGASLKHCALCRLQFYDLRRRLPKIQDPGVPPPGGAAR
jgi:hypothetical protein